MIRRSRNWRIVERSTGRSAFIAFILVSYIGAREAHGSHLLWVKHSEGAVYSMSENNQFTVVRR